MKPQPLFRRGLLTLLSAALVCTLVLPASAFFWGRKEETPTISDFSKNGLFGETISFSQKDFAGNPKTDSVLSSITVTTLPDPNAGQLTIGGQPVSVGTSVDATALAGLRFEALQNPSLTTTAFTFIPTFSGSKSSSHEVTVTLHLLEAENKPPIARNMDLSTYKNIAITGYFDAVDGEGDALTFQLTAIPARGAVELAEDGSGCFVYTPYENKTGTDSFTYVAIDGAGNTSSEARITVQIDKPHTKVVYSDLQNSPVHKAAIRLAEKNILVGTCMNGQYFFQPDTPVSRAEFLSMAMTCSSLKPMEGVQVTGFFDDASIPSWSKGEVAAALKAGVIQGSKSSTGAPVFVPNQPITQGEATAMLNRLLNMADVPMEVFSTQGGNAHWAGQAAANLAAAGVMRIEDTNAVALSDTLTRGEAASLLDGALDVLATREDDSMLPWS